VLLYILLSGKPPFNGKDEIEIQEKIKIGEYNMDDKIWESISSEAKDLIKLMLTFDYNMRPFANEIL
jgi:calcium-dependent protein kinase